MTDWDHYKKAYSDEWDAGVRREALVADVLEQLGFSVEMEGLGAGSTEFISGRAEQHGKTKADPDLFVPETKTHIEVTGTNIDWVRPDRDIRIRPDKFENALASPGEEHWVVHVLDGPALLRCVELTKAVCTEFHDQGVSRDTRHDSDETYVEIDPDHDCIQPFQTLLHHLAPDAAGEYETAIQTALARWTTVEDIEVGNDDIRYSIGLQLRRVQDWEDHDWIDKWLHMEDHTGKDVIVTIFNDGVFASNSWTEGQWYLFSDLEEDFHEGDAFLKPTPESEVTPWTDEQTPVR